MHPAYLTLLSIQFLIILFICGVILSAQKKVFEKAGYSGWKAFIPIYNVRILYEIAGLSKLSFISSLVLSKYQGSVLSDALAKSFGKDTSYQGAYFFFGIVPLLLSLGFGDYKYIGSKHKTIAKQEA